jgi:hypothetical protein
MVGWHFPEAVFQSLSQVRNTDIFIVSHQPHQLIPSYVNSVAGKNHVLVEPNYGYDWGCYQQFLDRGIWRDYRHVVFMHDDLVVKQNDFIDAGLAMLDRHSVVGNSRIEIPRDWPSSHPESYVHASWRPPPSFVHDVVRGSFFMVKSEALERLVKFEVHWDRYRTSSTCGNWSTRATCAKWQRIYGNDCFGFLSEQGGVVSDYLIEMVRGKEAWQTLDEIRQVCSDYQDAQPYLKKKIYREMYQWGRWWMERYRRRVESGGSESPLDRMVERLLLHMAGHPPFPQPS